MPYIKLSNFKYGLDTRRFELASAPGTLQTALNCHINQGGEIEKRKEFVLWATLPSTNTHKCFGLEAGTDSLITFSQLDTTTIQTNLRSIKLLAPTGSLFPFINYLSAVRLSTNYAGVPWVVAEFLNGDVWCFAGPEIPAGLTFVAEFLFGRAVTNFTAVGSLVNFLVHVINGGSVSNIVLPVGAPGFTADTQTGTGFHIYSTPGLDYDIETSVVSAAGTLSATKIFKSTPEIQPVAASGSFQITGGGVAGLAVMEGVKVNGVEILNTTGSNTVAWRTGNGATAAAIASAINRAASTPSYLATQGTGLNKNRVILTDNSSQGATANGFVVQTTTSGNMTVDKVAFKITGGSVLTTVDATSILVGAQALLNSTVTWITDDETFANLIAAAIRAYSGTSGYTAFAGGTVDIRISKVVRNSDDVLTDLVVTKASGPGTIAAGTTGVTTDVAVLTVVVNTSFVQGNIRGGFLPASIQATTGSVTTFTSGGTPPYRYQWTKLDGDEQIFSLAPTAAFSAFKRLFPASQKPQYVSSRFVCTVTDSASPALTAQSPPVTVVFIPLN